ncbi:MAG: hypothetical protein QOJ07_1558 [Thermoleophilaceae bacterium]|nr:hypothetical protein [Thermoleophilaceae bacterium]
MTEPGRIEELETEARYARDRLALYRAKAQGAQATSVVRMRQLERDEQLASERLRAARERA